MMIMSVVVRMADVAVVKGEYSDEVDRETEDTDDEELFYFHHFFGPDESSEGFGEDT